MPSVSPTIPGVNSTYSKMVEDLMKVERIPLDNKAKDIDETTTEKEGWQKINTHLTRLVTSTKMLYGFENPFSQKIAESSNPSVLTASPTRDAQVQDFEITVHNMAKADKFKSAPLPINYQVPKGRYNFAIGDKEIPFYFRGGTLNEFSAMLNSRGKNLIKSNAVKINNDSQIWMLESTQVGSMNTLSFKDDAMNLVLDAKMITNEPMRSNHVDIAQNINLKFNESKTIHFPNSTAKEGTLFINYSIKEDPVATAKAQEQALAAAQALEAKQIELASAMNSQNKNPLIPSSGSTTVEDVTLFQAPSFANFSNLNKIEEIVTPQEPEENPISNLPSSLVLNRLSEKTQITIDPTKQSISFDLSTIQDIEGLTFNNIFENQDFKIDSVYISDKSSRDYTPQSPISLAEDAQLEYNGLNVTRPTNLIDDLVYGTELNIIGESSEPVSISLMNDKETVKNALFEYVYNYNNVMQTINIFTSSDPEIIEELTYLEDSEREILEESLGTMKGDTTLNSLKRKMQESSTSLWLTSPNNSIQLLSQMGIGSNMSSSGGGFNPAKLRGYLEVDEEILDNAIESRLDEIKDFFGYDSDGDLVIDKGLAVDLTNKLQAYTQTGGIIFTKFRTFDTRIENLEEQTRTMEQKLETREAEYKRKFGQMEGLIEEMNKNAEALNGLNQGGNK